MCFSLQFVVIVRQSCPVCHGLVAIENSLLKRHRLRHRTFLARVYCKRLSPPDIRCCPVPEILYRHLRLVIGVVRLRRYAEIYSPYSCVFLCATRVCRIRPQVLCKVARAIYCIGLSFIGDRRHHIIRRFRGILRESSIIECSCRYLMPLFTPLYSLFRQCHRWSKNKALQSRS